MKWNKEQENQLRELAFAEKSNKEIAETMGIGLTDVHAGRSRFGVTREKVKAAKNNLNTRRSSREVSAEIAKVRQAMKSAQKKVDRCGERIEQLLEELMEVQG